MKFPLKDRKYNFYMYINATKYTNLIKKQENAPEWYPEPSCNVFWNYIVDLCLCYVVYYLEKIKV